MAVILVTGTPGTGKTKVAKDLAEKLNFFYLDVSKLISLNKLSEGYDKKRKTKIIDTKRLNKVIIKELKNLNKVVIDSHLSHYLPKKYADFCIVTKCDIKILSKRLRGKKFGKKKIEENLQSEIFDVCRHEARDMGHKIITVDTTKGFNINEIASKITTK